MQVVERDHHHQQHQYYYEEEDYEPRFTKNGSLSCSMPFSPFVLVDSISRKSFSYNKLPQEPLKLTVLKLDDSSFEIEVLKTGTVKDLKQAVEAAFSHLPKKGPGKVSWSHLWAQFCLCYDGQKLLMDSDDIGCYGIKDGDQLKFIRHASISYSMLNQHSDNEDPDLDEPSVSGGSELRNENSPEEDSPLPEHIVNLPDDDNEDDSVTTRCDYKLTHLLRGWFSYHKLSRSDTRMEQRSSPSRYSDGLFGSFKNVVRNYSSRNDSRRVAWKAE